MSNVTPIDKARKLLTPAELLENVATHAASMRSIVIAYTEIEDGVEVLRTCWSNQTNGSVLFAAETIKLDVMERARGG